MQKIKYIIIFILILALGMIYIQLTDYKSISTTLLDNNTNNATKIGQLNNEILLLKQNNNDLIDKITSLEEELKANKIKENYNKDIESLDLNYELPLNSNSYQKIDEGIIQSDNLDNEFANTRESYEKVSKEKVNSSSLTPNIEIDMEKETVTGIGIQYEQKF